MQDCFGSLTSSNYFKMKTLALLVFVATLLISCDRKQNTKTTNASGTDSVKSVTSLDTASHKAQYDGSDSVRRVASADTVSSHRHSNSAAQSINQDSTNAQNLGAENQSRSQADLPSILESVDIKFDENFAPIATIKLHNTTGREINQILFRFTFTNHELSDGIINYIDANEYSSYVNLSVVITPPFSKTVQIRVPAPQRKNFDKPNVFITKIRYYDGSIDTDAR